jgi:hypothetical protein
LFKQRSVIIIIGLLMASIIPFADGLDEINYSINIESPNQGASYGSDVLTVKVKTAPYRMEYYNSVFDVDCYLDGQFYSKISLQEAVLTEHEYLISDGAISLQGLSQGEHTVTVSGKGTVDNWSWHGGGDLSPVKVSFFVNLGVVPVVSVSSLSEYQTSQVGLNITTDRVDAAVSYSLDGLANVTLPKNEAVQVGDGYQYNVSLFGLADGQHVINAYAADSFGNTGTTVANFQVHTATDQPSKNSQNPSSLPITEVIAGVIVTIIIVSAVGLLLLNKRHKTLKV